jgi:condensin complex subunit 1
MPPFALPVHFEDLEQSHEERFCVAEVTDVPALSASQQDRQLGAVVELVDETPLCVKEQANFDLLYSFVRHFPALSGGVQAQLFETLQHGLSQLCAATTAADGLPEEQVGEAREAMKMMVLLLTEAMYLAEEQDAKTAAAKTAAKTSGAGAAAKKPKKKKKKRRGRYDSDDSDDDDDDDDAGGGGSSSRRRGADGLDWGGVMRAHCVAALAAVLAVDLQRLWKAQPEEEFVALFTRAACKACESPAAMRAGAEGATAVLRVLAAAATTRRSISSSLEAQLMQLLTTHEHFSTPLAELGELMADEEFGSNTQVMVELFNDIRGMAPDASGARHVAKFLEELAERVPSLVLQCLSTLMHHLDADNHSMRSGICGAIGAVVRRKFGAEACAEAAGGVDAEGAEISEAAVEQSKRDAHTRDNLLSILEARLRDTSSFTRAAVLKTWMTLIEDHAVPHKMLPRLTKLCAERLRDKTASVRKQAIILFGVLLENNPFGQELSPKTWHEAYDYCSTWFEANPMPDMAAVANKLAAQAAQSDGDEAEAAGEQQQDGDDDGDDAEEEPVMGMQDQLAQFAQLTEDHKKHTKMQNFAQQGLSFVQTFTEDVLPMLETFIGAKTVSDAQEAMRFFVLAHGFNFPGAGRALRKILGCVWSHEPTHTIKTEAIDTVHKLYVLEPGETSRRLPPAAIARNLVALAGGCNVSEMTSLGQVIQLMMADRKLPRKAIDALWEVAEFKRDGAAVTSAADLTPALARARADSQVALRILALAASADRAVIDSQTRLEALLEVGLGELTRAEGDFGMAQYCCLALKMLPQRGGGEAWRAEHIDAAMANVHHLLQLTGGWAAPAADNRAATLAWFPAAQEALDCIFLHEEHPERSCADTVRALAAATLGSANGRASSDQLARLFFTLGHVALKMLVRTEQLAVELKKMRGDKETRKAARAASGGGAEDEEEEDVDAAAEAETEDDNLVLRISEHELVGHNLLGAFGPMIEAVVANRDGKFSDPLLRQAATMALSKFMGISSVFCDRNLKLLFTVLLQAPEPALRANAIVALGDLAFRFPNSVEPWTDNLYAPLRDADVSVRKNTLQVLTHLILNDMVKVRGKIAEICICLMDGDSRIKGLANLFFDELAKRESNPIYNLLPDIISTLSKADSVTAAHFQEIMMFLMGPKFISKEKHTLSLVDKLCQRFPATLDTESDMQEARDLSFCMSTLSFSDKAVKKLIESFKLYKLALGDAAVYASFAVILKKMAALKAVAAKKGTGDAADASGWEEWEAEVAKVHEQEAENLASSANAKRNTAKANKTSSATAVKAEVAAAEQDEEEQQPVDAGASAAAAEEEEEETTEAVAAVADDVAEEEPEEQPTRGRRSKKSSSAAATTKAPKSKTKSRAIKAPLAEQNDAAAEPAASTRRSSRRTRT